MATAAAPFQVLVFVLGVTMELLGSSVWDRTRSFCKVPTRFPDAADKCWRCSGGGRALALRPVTTDGHGFNERNIP